jgi:ribosome-associated toxin RatA of RatAB toxin-antitoxin module
MHSEIAIRIAAPPDLVFALAHDVERWADLLPHYVRSAAVERRPDGSLVADFIARRPLIGVLGLGLPVTWRSRTWSEPATRRLRFVHVAGATKGMDVTWRIEPAGAGAGDHAGGGTADVSTGCTVTIEHDFAPRLPGFAAFVDRFFTRPIAGRTLATFKALAEALQSGTPLPTNPSP